MTVYQINQFITRWGLKPEQVIRQASGKYQLPAHLFHIRRQALDVRGKRPRAVYTLEVPVNSETSSLSTRSEVKEIQIRTLKDELRHHTPNPDFKPIIVGMGPAGLFAAMVYAEAGITPVILERGAPVEDRAIHVTELWTENRLNTESNPLFGEGGAGTFSDGKLSTRINDPLVRYILEQLAAFGARERILVDAKPHIGTDRLIRVMQQSRSWLLEKGAEIRFNTCVTGFRETASGVRVQTATGDDLDGSVILLAIGHSARDTYERLLEIGVAMESKPFAVGSRIEHPQEMIDDIMYGKKTRGQYGLPPVSYQFAWNGPAETGCYSFCMCPGGEIILTVNEAGTLCVNGMSNSKRNSPFANAAIVGKVPVTAFDNGHALDGVAFQRKLEEQAYQMGVPGFMAPSQPVQDFLKGQMPRKKLPTSYANGTYAYPLHELLPEFVTQQMRNGLEQFNRRARGFTGESANLVGIESRTSAPVRIVRNPETGRSVSHQMLFPCGEGAGYAGGIVSAAVDGMRAALRSMG